MLIIVKTEVGDSVLNTDKGSIKIVVDS